MTGLFDMGAPDFQQERWTVRYVGPSTAAQWMKQYHYSGSAPTCPHIGVFGPDLMLVAGIGPTANIAGIAGKFGLSGWRGNEELRRVAKHPDCTVPTSRLLKLALRFYAANRWDWLFTYADTGEGHHGGIYQALGAVYLGATEPVAGYLVDGKPVHPRQVVELFGTRARASLPPNVQIVPGLVTPKHLYVIPTAASRSVRASIREHLARYALPYPKRAEAASSDAPGSQSGEGGSQPTLPLHTSEEAA